jgi:hypothetical protein
VSTTAVMVISAVTIAADPAAIVRVNMNVLVVVAKAESTAARCPH